MLLRPRQTQAVERSLTAIQERGNSLLVAPTGAGKTVMSGAVAQAALKETGEPVLFLQHRDELVAQNRRTFISLAGPEVRTSVIDGKIHDAHGKVVFAMVQSLVNRLETLPKVGLVITDETHHSAAKTYQKIYQHVRELNSGVRFFGVTATPDRGDRKALTSVYNNVSDIITLGELIAAGNLVRPRAMVVDLGVQDDLRRVRRSASDFDMSEVEAIMDKQVLNEAVVEKWKEVATDRQTVVFCSTIEHGKHVAAAFRAAGVEAEFIDGNMKAAERASILSRFDRGDFRVLVNVFVLTEGWDCQPVSCVILLRPSSHKSTMIQMIGRGLRKLDPERYPGRFKLDCIVMDFGTSLLTHGSLDQDVRLEPRKAGTPMQKSCPGCLSQIPLSARECPLCGHEFPAPEAPAEEGERAVLGDFVLREIDILAASPFRWETLWDGSVLIATSFSAWAMAVFYGGRWYSVGGSEADGVHLLDAGQEASLACLSTADDFLRKHGKASEAGKAKQWLMMPPTDKQLQALGLPAGSAMTRYQAACFLTWKFNERSVKSKIMGAARSIAA